MTQSQVRSSRMDALRHPISNSPSRGLIAPFLRPFRATPATRHSQGVKKFTCSRKRWPRSWFNLGFHFDPHPTPSRHPCERNASGPRARLSSVESDLQGDPWHGSLRYPRGSTARFPAHVGTTGARLPSGPSRMCVNLSRCHAHLSHPFVTPGVTRMLPARGMRSPVP